MDIKIFVKKLGNGLNDIFHDDHICETAETVFNKTLYNNDNKNIFGGIR